MAQATLVIGSRNLSSWSLRAWLVLRQAGLAFDEIAIELDRPDTQERIRAYSPSGRVPVLIQDGLVVWDSLAIAEHVAESHPELWPRDPVARALARSVAAEMHSGFTTLRARLPMDWLGRHPTPDLEEPKLAEDIARIAEIWRDCRSRYGEGGPFLFGQFTIADAMFAPVCSRFVTYDVPRDAVGARYVEAVMGLEALQEWTAGARRERGEPLAVVADTPAEARSGPVKAETPPVVAPTRAKDSPVKPIGAGTRRRRDDRPAS